MLKKICSIIVSICGLALVITGIVILAMSYSHCGVTGGGISRASTEIKFGADYYTTMAQYSALNANATVDIYKLIKICFGITFIFSGLITFFLSLPNALKKLKTNSENQAVDIEPINENTILEEENI